jgi:hypothetical protein
MSREEKIREIQELLQKSRDMDSLREQRRRGNVVEFEAANTIRKMLQDVAKDKNLSDQEKKQEFQRVLEEAQKMKLERMKPMIGIEKFKFELNQLLKNEGVYPEGKAEFVLKLKECSIDGKKLPDDLHQKILKLSETSLGKEFDRNTKIILQLNENR